ncbi:MAG: carboxypeptidase-like regulatory domain-containing protein, partial [Flavobacterium sp.]
MNKLLYFLLLISSSSWSQFVIQGIVKNESTQKGIPFVTINAKGISILSDVNGYFEWKGTYAADVITISRVGFESQVIKVNPGKPHVIYLTSSVSESETLKNEELKGLNLIQQVHQKSHLNDPGKQFSTFKHKGYHRLVVTAQPDSIRGIIDSVYSKKQKRIIPDSTAFKFKELISKQHLFQFEKSSLYQFNGHQFKETVLGTKMSGFKKPVYEIISFDLQPNSVYSPLYEMFETKYINPISNHGMKSYQFLWLDSLNIGKRKTHLVYFKNKKKSLRRGLEGVLYIDAETHGIAKAIYRIRGVLDISSIHHFEFEPAINLWLPKKNEFKIVKGQNDDPIKILGGTIRFEGDYDPFKRAEQNDISDHVFVYAQSQFYDWHYNSPVSFKRKYMVMDIPDEAINREDDFWKKTRKDSLSARDLNTYKALDSIFFKEKWENKLLFGRKIINGYVPVGLIDFDLRYLLSFNNYEGFRLGLGGITNDQFSKKFRLEGYGAFGTKDLKSKYMGGFSTRIGKASQSWTGFSFTDDIREIASTNFSIDKRTFKIYDPRPINVTTFYRHRTWKTFLETRILPKTEAIWQLSSSEVIPLFPYEFIANGQNYTNFNMTTAQVSILWSPYS